MDEQLAMSVADGLVKVTGPPDGCFQPVWAVTFGVGASTYCLTDDREKTARSVAEALRMLVFAAIKRYNGGSPAPEITEVSESLDRRLPVSKKDPPPMPQGGLMPDLFAGELEAMSKILDRVSGLLGREARRLMDLRRAAADLAAEAEDVAHDMPSGSTRDSLLLKVGAVSEALAALSKE